MGLQTVLAASGLAAIANLAGVYLVRLQPRFTERALRSLVSVAGGIVLGAAFLHLLPEAAAVAPHAYLIALAAFLTLYLVESHTLPHIHDPADDHGHPPRPRRGLAALFVAGSGIHALFDGLAIAAGYSRGTALGNTSVIAVLAHKLPEGIAIMTLLLHWHFDRKQALWLAWALALVTPATAVASAALLGGGIGAAQLGALLAVVAGCFLYIGGADLLPEIRREPRWSESALILAGAGLMWFLKLIFH